MSALWSVARWEFLRFAKVKDLVIGVVSTAVGFGVYGLSASIVERIRDTPRDVAVVSGEVMSIGDGDTMGVVTFRALDALPDDWVDGEFDGALVVETADTGTLYLNASGRWGEELVGDLTTHRLSLRPAEVGLSADVVAALGAPVDIRPVSIEAGSDGRPRTSTGTVLVVMGAMLMALFLGFSYVFVAITGEKTQRVTESVLSAISHQTWMDGKILGLSGVVGVSLFANVVGYLVYKAVASLAFGKPFSFPVGVGDPASVVVVVVLALLGFGFWFTFFAAVAATINDPNTSSRSSLLFLPFLPLGLTLAGMDHANSWWMKLLAAVPGVSPAAMTVRVLRGEPSVVAVIVTVVLAVLAIWVLRRMAAGIFGASMMMTGSEPSLADVWRLATRSTSRGSSTAG